MMTNAPTNHHLDATLNGEQPVAGKPLDTAVLEIQQKLFQLLELISQQLDKHPNTSLVASVDVFAQELEVAWQQNSKEKLEPFVPVARTLLEQLSPPGTTW